MIRIREYRRKDDWVRYEMYVNGENVGGASVVEFQDCTYLERIDIYDGYMSQGHGTRFINWLANRYDGIIAAPDNEGCQRLFSRLGDEEEVLLQGYDQGHGLYRVESSPVEGIEFYVDHEPLPKPEPQKKFVNFDPLGKGKV